MGVPEMRDAKPMAVEVGDDVLYKRVRDGAILLNLRKKEFYSLDGIGARIWYLLLENGSIDAVADRLSVEYDADRSAIFSDVEAIAHDLGTSGLLKLTHAGSLGLL
jgi:hypothetical protein